MATPGCLDLDRGVCHGRESNDEEYGPEGARLSAEEQRCRRYRSPVLAAPHQHLTQHSTAQRNATPEVPKDKPDKEPKTFRHQTLACDFPRDMADWLCALSVLPG